MFQGEKICTLKKKTELDQDQFFHPYSRQKAMRQPHKHVGQVR